jgi:glutamine amidotransferase
MSHVPGEITTAHEISVRNRLFNVDGFGLAWYTTAREDFNTTASACPALYKYAGPPLHDLNFRSICANTATKACFAHIRAATATPVVAVNNHPFVFGRHKIMHNGIIEDFTDIQRDVCSLLDTDTYANIQGRTDSEHFAALYVTYLTSGKGAASWDLQYPPMAMRAALVKAMDIIMRLQKSKIGEKCVANSLNVCATDGKQLVAMRCRNHTTEQPPSLYYSTSAGVTLNRKYPDHPDEGKDNANATKSAEEHGRHVIVASEPTTYKADEWMVIEKNHSITVDMEMNVLVEKLDIPAELNATIAGVGF